jgi:type I restriction-modification system DNA methylase subunit
VLAGHFAGLNPRLKATPQDYHGHGAVFLPETARFSYLLGLPETENLADALNEAMKGITEYNPDLAGGSCPKDTDRCPTGS